MPLSLKTVSECLSSAVSIRMIRGRRLPVATRRGSYSETVFAVFDPPAARAFSFACRSNHASVLSTCVSM